MSSRYRRSYWQQLKRACEGCHPKLSLNLCMFEESFSFGFFGFFIPLPFMQRLHRNRLRDEARGNASADLAADAA